jgi:hypothetical protein
LEKELGNGTSCSSSNLISLEYFSYARPVAGQQHTPWLPVAPVTAITFTMAIDGRFYSQIGSKVDSTLTRVGKEEP